MSSRHGVPVVLLLVVHGLFLSASYCHDLSGDPDNPQYDWSVHPPETIAAISPSTDHHTKGETPSGSAQKPAQAAVFESFAPRVKVRWDDRYLFVESNGLPSHGMMSGITAWQQQVPLPQNYFGDNAWRFPLFPVPAARPKSTWGHFLRGAIAIAANGIPIFNPQNNRGELSAEIGELDRWGGHCGRADDYHYHAAPLHLQGVVGTGSPIAYALDGYPIYGLNEPDGSMPVALDSINGHSTPSLSYHYHASSKYPYVNGGFHGEVAERDGQVDPQPGARPIRPSLTPLRGASITQFAVSPDEKDFSLKYVVDGKSGEVNYSATAGGRWNFQFIDPDGTKREQIYPATAERGPDGPPPPKPDRASAPARGISAPNEAEVPDAHALRPTQGGHLTLKSPEVVNGGDLPADYTGDGSGATLPLEWRGAPEGTRGYALVMHHIPGPGDVKSYWILYNIPPDVKDLPKNAKNIGTWGNNSINGRAEYAPPHSKGPGPKIYILTLYALAAQPKLEVPASAVNREALLEAMKGLVLDSAELKFVYTRPGNPAGEGVWERPPGP